MVRILLCHYQYHFFLFTQHLDNRRNIFVFKVREKNKKKTFEFKTFSKVPYTKLCSAAELVLLEPVYPHTST